ncbi:MAG: anthranilate phosphoribosyltransferase [bacterium]|nr:anthranilate phosphoribosyltransferase [bacterium]
MKNLTQQETQRLIERMMNGGMSQYDMAETLKNLAQKGETPDEILGAIHALRSNMQTIQASAGSIDTCGTGGDGKNTFNISTIVALVVAGAGVPVVKHGNRSISSKCGSADVLEELGVNIHLKPHEAQKVLNRAGIVFLFAPVYHAAMKHVVKVRKELGMRTIFNVLGPFCNPANVSRQVIGVPNLDILATLTQVAQKLLYDHVALVTSEDGMDEISPTAKTYVHIIKGSELSSLEINPHDYGIHHTSLSEILGGDPYKNASIIRSVLNREMGAPRDTVLLNAALALHIAGKASTFEEGIEMAKVSIDSGAAKAKLALLISSSQI